MKRLAQIGLGLLLIPLPLSADLRQGLEAHGSMKRWSPYKSVRFDATVAVTGFPLHKDRYDVDLIGTRMRVTSPMYDMGFDGKDAWAKAEKPPEETTGLPPRYAMLSTFYFFSMPFIFNDPGVTEGPPETMIFQGVTYEAIRFNFKASQRLYPFQACTAYFDKTSHVLKLVHFIADDPSVAANKQPGEMDHHAILFNDWQDLGWLKVPAKISLFDWEDENITKPQGTITFSKINFKRGAARDSLFTSPVLTSPK